MNIRVIAVGKIKERYLRQGIEIYLKSLGRFCDVEIIEVADEKAPESLSSAQEAMVKSKEGQRIKSAIRSDSYVIALAIEGQALSSQAFAKKLRAIKVIGRENIDFIIGGSLGLDDEILRKADYLLSFSKLTFPHQLMRLILLEQIHRAMQIRCINQ